MTTLTAHRPTAVPDAPAVRGTSWGRALDRLWLVGLLLGVLLPVAGLVVAAATGQELWLLPAAVVAGLVALALTVWS